MFLLSKAESDQKVWKSAAPRPTGYPKSVGLQKNNLGKALQWLKKLWCCSVEVVFRCNLVPLCEDNTGFVFTPNSVKPLLPGCIGDNSEKRQRCSLLGTHWEYLSITPTYHSGSAPAKPRLCSWSETQKCHVQEHWPSLSKRARYKNRATDTMNI